MPLASSSMSSASPSQPGKEKWALPGSRPGPGGGPLSTASGTAARTCAISSSRPARPAAAPRRPAAWTASATATAKARMAGASSVPDRTSRSWPPPCSTGTGSTCRASSSAPTPTGPPILCPVMVSAAAPLTRRSPPAAARPPAPRRCGTGSGTRGPPRPARATGCDRADLVVRPHDADQRHAAGIGLDGRAQRVRADQPGAVDRQPADLGALVAGQPVHAVQHGVVLDRRWPAPGGGRRRPSRRAQYRPLTARLSASVPPLVKTTSLGRAP